MLEYSSIPPKMRMRHLCSLTPAYSSFRVVGHLVRCSSLWHARMTSTTYTNARPVVTPLTVHPVLHRSRFLKPVPPRLRLLALGSSHGFLVLPIPPPCITTFPHARSPCFHSSAPLIVTCRSHPLHFPSRRPPLPHPFHPSAFGPLTSSICSRLPIYPLTISSHPSQTFMPKTSIAAVVPSSSLTTLLTPLWRKRERNSTKRGTSTFIIIIIARILLIVLRLAFCFMMNLSSPNLVYDS